ncbi:unnamed protein product [Schistosoma spindalis]|nr:unnamed protein product [Schistosoma spindale]
MRTLISCRYGLPVCYADTWEIAVVRSVRRDSFDQLAVCRFLTRSLAVNLETLKCSSLVSHRSLVLLIPQP